MMKRLALIILLLLSFNLFAAELFITSPLDGYVLRSDHGKISLEGNVNFASGENTNGNLGKVICNDKQGPVKPHNYRWQINNLKLGSEGYNTISCSYSRNGQTSSKTITILWSRQNVIPEAKFTFSPESGRAPLIVDFDASDSHDPDGTIVSYSWDFGDGSTGEGLNTSHRYLTSGSYNITLTVMDNEQLSSSITKYLYVDVPSIPPVVQVTASPVSGESPLSVTFDASMSYDPDGGSLKEYHFDFGDGTQEVSLLPYVVHIYQNEGAYTARITVVDTEEEESEPFEIVIQSFSANEPPIAIIESSEIAGYPPLEVLFSGARSSDPDGSITSYTWYFPNGVIKAGVEVSHVFEQSGNFEVTLVVKDNKNVPSEAKVSIQVNLDEVGPTLAIYPENQSFLRTDTPQFEILHSDVTSGIDLSSIKAYMDGDDVSSRLSVSPDRSILSYTLDNPLSAGVHELRIEIKDKAGNVSVLVSNYRIELGEIKISYISGTILDLDNNPIEGVSVQEIYTAPKVKIDVKTDSNGRYKIPFSRPGTYRLSFNKPGYTESVRTITPSIVQDTNLELIYMGQIDPVVTPISAVTGGIGENSTGSLRYEIPAGILPFDVNLTLTEFTDGRALPGPLPIMSMFTYAFETRPFDVQLNGTATLHFENSLGFPVGTPIVYGVFDRDLGRWLDSGYTAIVGEEKNTAMPIPTPTFQTGDPNIPGFCSGAGCLPLESSGSSGPGPCTKECCPTGPPGPPVPSFSGPDGNTISKNGTVMSCKIDTKTGDLSVDHDLAGIFTGGEDFSLRFAYHSTQTIPQFFINTKADSADTEPPLKVESSITIAGNSFNRTYEGDNLPVNTFYRALFPATNQDGEYFPTGTYAYTHLLSALFNSEYATAAYFGGPPLLRLSTITRVPIIFRTLTNDRTTIINRRLSPFGGGWGIIGLEKLHIAQDGVVMWENGGKGETYYTPIGSSAQYNKVTFTLKNYPAPKLNSLKAMNGVFYGTDCENNVVYRISASGNYDVVAGNGTAGFSGDGKDSTEAQLNCPMDIAPAETGGFYIADSNNFRIRRVSADGKIKTIAHYPEGKPLSVSEDKMRAVYFTTRSSVMLLTPRGELQVYSKNNEGYVETNLKNPSQVLFNHDDYPMVVDTDNGRIITMYPQAKNIVTNLNGLDKTLKTQFKPKSVTFDPVLKIYYILDTNGELHTWNGHGIKKIKEISLEENLKLSPDSSMKKNRRKIDAMAFSPELGFAFISNGDVLLSRNVNKLKNIAASVSYLSQPGNFDQLEKKSDGTFEITQVDNIKRVFDVRGNLIAILRPDAKNSIYQYNERGLISLITFPGGSYQFEYDGRGYISTIRDSANRVTNFNVDNQGRLTRIENPDGSEKNYTYGQDNFLLEVEIDEEGKQKLFEYQNGKIIRETLPGGRVRDILPEQLKENQYPTSDIPVSGTVLRAEEIFTVVSTKSGDCNLKAKFENGVLKESEDCLGAITKNTVNTDGRITSTQTPEGRNFSYLYDTKGRLTSSVDASGTSSYTFDSIWGKLASVSDSLYKTVSMSYNDKGLLEQTIDQDNFSTSFSYDEFGNLTLIRDALNHETILEYDERNNLNAVMDPLGNRLEYTRDAAGNILSSKDPENRITQFEHDELNRLVGIYDPMNFVTSLTYTPMGKIKTVTDARNFTTSFNYHPSYDVVEQILNPLDQSESFTYDLDERIKSKTNKDGTTINFNYDRNGRLILKTTATDSTSYVYDKDGLTKEVANNDATISMNYDNYARFKSTSSSHVPGTLIYEYDSRGLKSQMVYEIGGLAVMRIDYSYNNRRLLSGMSANLSGINIGWERFWDELGRPETDIYSNGMTIERRYDPAGKLLYLSNQLNESTPLSRFEYQYNNAGTIKEITKTFTRPEQGNLGREVLGYTYDALDRLTFASTDGSFGYDELGNHLQRGGTYNALNQLGEDSEFIYNYTVNGNLNEKISKITGEKTQYFWDHENRLNQIVVRHSSNSIKREVVYKYDGMERRISKISNGKMVKFAFDKEDIIIEFNADNSIAALYLHGPGIDEPVAMVRDVNQDGEFAEDELFFFGKDHLNSVHTLTDKSGKPVQRYSYTAYGETKVEKTNPSNKLIKNFYAYTSREWEEETGDYYYRARYYDPNTGRFLSEDPIGFAGRDTNMYRYVLNDPIKYKDPTGLLRNPGDIMDEALDHPSSSSGTNGSGNAFQHCFASCMMAAENGGIAAFLAGHAFEAVNGMNGQSKADWAMDVSNNATGRKLGDSCPYKNTTSFDPAKSKEISKSCAASCGSTGLTFMSM